MAKALFVDPTEARPRLGAGLGAVTDDHRGRRGGSAARLTSGRSRSVSGGPGDSR